MYPVTGGSLVIKVMPLPLHPTAPVAGYHVFETNLL